MLIREAKSEDIPQIQVVRNSVKENILSNPALVSDEDCEEFINQRGKGWVCEIDGNSSDSEQAKQIVGFSIVDLKDNNVWALFLHPDFEKQGIGRKLHDVMIDWYFTQTQDDLWLGTAPGTRAEAFYHKAGWRENGMYGRDSSGSEQPKETKFEMTFKDWQKLKS